MPDRRAMILDRLEELLGTITGAPASTVYRNRSALPADKRPCMVLLDGAETTFLSREGQSGRGMTHDAPCVMRLEPQIFALLEVRPISEASEYASELTQYRNAILGAILTDAELLMITGENGDIAYRGHQTDMQNGMLQQGELQMDFAFYYVLDPRNDL